MHAQPARRRPSAALIVSLLALFVALSGSGRAATIENIVLGKTNTSTKTTGLASSTRTPVLAVTDTGAGVAASFTVKAGAQPFTVNSTTKVRKLNADLLDGQDSTSFWALGGNTLPNETTPSGLAFLGSKNNRPVVFGADGQPYFGLVPGQGSVFLGTVHMNGDTNFDGTAEFDGGVGIGTDPGSSPLTVEADSGVVIQATTAGGTGVQGMATTSGTGVSGSSDAGVGVVGATSSNVGVQGTAGSGVGVLGRSNARGVIGVLGSTTCFGTLPYATGGCGGSAGIGVFGASQGAAGVLGVGTTQGVVGTLGPPCPGTAAVLACGAKTGDGVLAVISHAPNGSTAAAVHAINTLGGDLFIGETGNGVRVARINGAGKGFFDGGTQMGGADYADSMRAENAAQLRPGDVLAIDPHEGSTVGLAHGRYSSLVAGVYSTKPSVLGVGAHHLGSSLAGEVPVALVGIVPTRVSTENGPVRAGDLLTTSSTPGYAMKALPRLVHGVPVYPTGTILGKAMQPLASGKGLIKVLVTLR
jgi:hypothetical protein